MAQNVFVPESLRSDVELRSSESLGPVLLLPIIFASLYFPFLGNKATSRTANGARIRLANVTPAMNPRLGCLGYIFANEVRCEVSRWDAVPSVVKLHARM